MDIEESKKELSEIKTRAAADLRSIALIEKEMAAQEKGMIGVAEYLEEKLGKGVDKDLFLGFFKNPYVVMKNGRTLYGMMVDSKFMLGDGRDKSEK